MSINRKILASFASSANQLIKLICPNTSLSQKEIESFISEVKITQTKHAIPVVGSVTKRVSRAKPTATVSDDGRRVLSTKINREIKDINVTKNRLYVTISLPDIENKNYLNDITGLLMRTVDEKHLNRLWIDNVRVVCIIFKGEKFYILDTPVLTKFQALLVSLKASYSKIKNPVNVITQKVESQNVLKDNFSKIIEIYGEDKIKEWITSQKESDIEDLILQSKSNIVLKKNKIPEEF
jgi:hypothetical protein